MKRNRYEFHPNFEHHLVPVRETIRLSVRYLKCIILNDLQCNYEVKMELDDETVNDLNEHCALFFHPITRTSLNPHQITTLNSLSLRANRHLMSTNFRSAHSIVPLYNLRF